MGFCSTSIQLTKVLVHMHGTYICSASCATGLWFGPVSGGGSILSTQTRQVWMAGGSGIQWSREGGRMYPPSQNEQLSRFSPTFPSESKKGTGLATPPQG